MLRAASTAVLYKIQGQYAKAEILLQRSFSIREKALGPEHSDLAESLNNLATIYKDQGRYAKAEPGYLINPLGREAQGCHVALGPFLGPYPMILRKNTRAKICSSWLWANLENTADIEARRQIGQIPSAPGLSRLAFSLPLFSASCGSCATGRQC
jgi:tetratricopeptide (TPR) repeat protein